ncbi:MAG: fused MFS/spermidine synthase [Frankiales bacterium]|nr:fused MFS/spermidine synthase [Frankiales bacterium]
MTAGRRVELLRDLDRETGRVLLVDGVEQSYVDLDDPEHLEFEYMQHMALAVDCVLAPEKPVAALHLGGGALSMPRWLAHRRPRSKQLVAESSAAVIAATSDLEPVPGCRVLEGDAMSVLAAQRARSFDLVFWDLYDGPLAVVDALGSADLQSMHRVLRPGGVLLLNVSDVRPFVVVRPVLAALREVADDLAVLAEPATLRGRRSGNCVLVARREASLPIDLLTRRSAAAPVRARVLAGDALTEFVGDARPPTPDEPLPRPDPLSGRAFL